MQKLYLIICSICAEIFAYIRHLATLFTAGFFIFLPLFFSAISAKAENNIKKISQISDWAVFSKGNGTECWAVSVPKSSTAKKFTKDQAVKRDEILLMITFNKTKNIIGEIAFTPGYPLKFPPGYPTKKYPPVEVTVGTQKFKFASEGSWAWPQSKSADAKVHQAFKKGVSVTVKGVSLRGMNTTDTFSLFGYTAAVKLAEKTCGLPEVDTDIRRSCLTDAKLCTPDQLLCRQASKYNISGKKVWRTTSEATKHVSEAKDKGLTCGVGNVVKQPAKSCDTDATLCTVAQLCRKSSKHNISGKKVWRITGEATKYIAEAKRNGVSCGVKSPVAQPDPKPRDNKTYEVSSGSGFYVSEAGHIVTNHHVVDGCKSMKIQSTGKVWDTTIIANDPQNDLALIKVDKKPAHVFALSAETPFPLQDIIVAGFPFGDSFSSALKFTQGIVSAGMGLGNNYSQIQIDAALQPGNSGGPIMDEYGNIVGVAVAKLSLKKIVDEYGVVPENTNFGVKASVVRNLMEGNRVPLKKPNYETVRKPKLSRMATDGTVHLTCWMTKAQIKEIIKRKDNRKVLFSQFETE